jgi:uncharacterized BrkB/YihY/UPF0761 family membrane protein
MVPIYGLFATPGDVIKQMSAFAGVLPPEVWDIINTQLQSITTTSQSTLTAAAALGVALALCSVRSAMSSLMTATNVAYREREKRSFRPEEYLLVTLWSAMGPPSRLNDAFRAVARAASPSTKSDQLSSRPLCLFFNVNLSPCGDIVRT